MDAGLDRDVDAFLGSSHVTSTGSIVCTFFMNEELVPIKIKRIPGLYILFNLVLEFVSNILMALMFCKK